MLYYLLNTKKTFTVCLVIVQTYFQAHWHFGFFSGFCLFVWFVIVICLPHVLFYLRCIRTISFFEALKLTNMDELIKKIWTLKLYMVKQNNYLIKNGVLPSKTFIIKIVKY